MNDFFDNQRILDIIRKHIFHFAAIGLIAIILSAIFSGSAFIKPKFRSTARIYPSNIWVLSEESETEQMLEVVNSRDIKLMMIDAFGLDEVYKISKDDPHYMAYMLDIYNKHVNAAKTKFETVEIRVMDKDPQRASDMCDSLIVFYNRKMGQMHKAKDFEMVIISKKNLEKKYAELDTLVAKINLVQKDYGILDFKSQVERVTEGYMTALSGGRSADGTKKIEQMYNNLAEKGTEALILESRLSYMITIIDSLNTLHDTHLSEYEKDISYSHVVEYPVPADKKSYPVRWLIVLFSTAAALFFALLVFLVLDYRKAD